VKFVLLAAAALATLAAALLLGPANVPFGELTASPIIWQLRLPRALLAFLVGGSLGVSGVGLQALVRNPLADPFLLGLSGGAGLGAVVAIALHLPGPWALPLAAFVGAVGAMALVYRLGLIGGAELDPRILLLGGVAVGAFAAAIMTALVSLAEATELRNAFLWLWGGFSGASWTTVLVIWCTRRCRSSSSWRPRDRSTCSRSARSPPSTSARTCGASSSSSTCPPRS